MVYGGGAVMLLSSKQQMPPCRLLACRRPGTVIHRSPSPTPNDNTTQHRDTPHIQIATLDSDPPASHGQGMTAEAAPTRPSSAETTRRTWHCGYKLCPLTPVHCCVKMHSSHPPPLGTPCSVPITHSLSLSVQHTAPLLLLLLLVVLEGVGPTVLVTPLRPPGRAPCPLTPSSRGEVGLMLEGEGCGAGRLLEGGVGCEGGRG